MINLLYIEILTRGAGENALPLFLAWVLIWIAHTAILLAGLWMATRWSAVQAPPFKEALWKTALVGAVLTASIHVVSGAGAVLETLRPRGDWVAHSEDDVAQRYALPVVSREAPRATKKPPCRKGTTEKAPVLRWN